MFHGKRAAQIRRHNPLAHANGKRHVAAGISAYAGIAGRAVGVCGKPVHFAVIGKKRVNPDYGDAVA